jgi:hypothetical protein
MTAPNPDKKYCNAKRRDGQQCQSWALKGKTKCRMHGGKSTGPKTPKGKAIAAASPLKHGAYSRLFSETFSSEEKETFKDIVAALESDEHETADKIMKENVALGVVKAARMTNPAPVMAEVRNQLKDLKASRVGREGEEGKDSAEVVVNFQWGEPEKKRKER